MIKIYLNNDQECKNKNGENRRNYNYSFLNTFSKNEKY